MKYKVNEDKLNQLIDDVYDGFDEYATTLEDGDSFRNPMDKLVEYLKKVGILSE